MCSLSLVIGELQGKAVGYLIPVRVADTKRLEITKEDRDVMRKELSFSICGSAWFSLSEVSMALS